MTQPEPTPATPEKSRRNPPRKSLLSDASPTRPLQGPQSGQEAAAVTGSATAPATTAEVPFRSTGGQPEEEVKKVGFYMKPSDLMRAKRAHTTTIIHTDLRSWTAYVNEAVMAYTKQLEAKYNDSKPF